MIKDEIVRMVREAGLNSYVNDVTEEPYATKLERFVNFAAAHEREECAKMLERIDLGAFKGTNAQLWFAKMLMDLANAIRTRGSMDDAEQGQIFRTTTVTTSTPTTALSSSNTTDQHN